MGIFNRILETWNQKTRDRNAGYGSHQIDKSLVLQPTDSTVFSPTNPGNFASIRSVPVLDSPRYFSKEEKVVLKQVAKQRKESAKHTQESYQALKQIDDADTTVHLAHYAYKGQLAGNEVKKLGANSNYAQKLHGLRPQYAQMSLNIDQANQQAVNKITQYRQQVQSTWENK